MLTTLTTLDLSSVFGGCGHKGQQQQQSIVQSPPQIINNYIPAPQQQQQQAIIQPPAAPQVPMALPRRPKSVSVAIDQTTTAAG